MNKQSAKILFASLIVPALLFEWRALLATFSLALEREEFTHILLILPIVVALFYVDRANFARPPQFGLTIGIVLLVAAAAVCISAAFFQMPADDRLSLNMLALVIWCAGSFVLSFGAKTARSFLFPLGFLLWMVPLPADFLDHIIAFLQRWSAFSAEALFRLAGVPVSQDGFFLTIPGLTVEVATECSSIRSSLILLVTTMVLAQLELRSFWRKCVVVAVAVPLTVAKNGLRIFIIAMLGTKVNRQYLTGNFHRHGGVIFLMLALAVILLLIWGLKRGEKPDSPGPAHFGVA